jgi:hypothetical protein
MKTLPMLVLILGLGGGSDLDTRPRHSLAPSLPQLTKEEEAKIQKVIDRFIQYDIGKLGGAAGRKALDDFNKLGPEAIFQLIDSFNEAAGLEHSCPAVIIGKKIGRILNASSDLELLTFARETLGAGVSARRHMGTVKDLQFGILLRRGTVQRQLALAGNGSTGSGKAPLTSSGQAPLTRVPSTKTPSAAEVRKWLKEDKAEKRVAAATQCASLKWGAELLELFQDSDMNVRKAAHKGLVRLNNGKDLGPENWNSPGDYSSAIVRWQAWWSQRKTSP